MIIYIHVDRTHSDFPAIYATCKERFARSHPKHNLGENTNHDKSEMIIKLCNEADIPWITEQSVGVSECIMRVYEESETNEVVAMTSDEAWSGKHE